jgi:hypothetical protein
MRAGSSAFHHRPSDATVVVTGTLWPLLVIYALVACQS